MPICDASTVDDHHPAVGLRRPSKSETDSRQKAATSAVPICSASSAPATASGSDALARTARTAADSGSASRGRAGSPRLRARRAARRAYTAYRAAAGRARATAAARQGEHADLGDILSDTTSRSPIPTEHARPRDRPRGPTAPPAGPPRNADGSTRPRRGWPAAAAPSSPAEVERVDRHRGECRDPRREDEAAARLGEPRREGAEHLRVGHRRVWRGDDDREWTARARVLRVRPCAAAGWGGARHTLRHLAPSRRRLW